jgi:prepilin-type N-terminal cleavage/methylation domain-containing protein
MQRNLSRGFSLIELLVVIILIVILASIAYPTYTAIQERAKATQDMSNLRQIGLATQMYLNDNDSVLFLSSADWMSQLHPKYLPAWAILQSPFDKRAASENGTAAPISPVSYGLNGNPKSGTSIAGLLMDKVTNPSAFIVFAPAQTNATTVAFSGTAAQAAPGVIVYKNISTPGGTYSLAPTHGTHSSRKRINALFADQHSENMVWSVFINDTASSSDTTANLRWDPYIPYP